MDFRESQPADDRPPAVAGGGGSPGGRRGASGRVTIESLVAHSRSVQAAESIERLYVEFGRHSDEFVGVLDGRRLVGVASRTAIMALLSGRHGFRLHARHPVGECIDRDHLAVAAATPLRELLDRAFARTGAAFHHDVALVAAAGEYLGMIPMAALVRLQSAILLDRTETIRAQHAALEERNRELFRSLNQLRQSRGRYEILFQNSALGVAVLDSRGMATEWNRRFAEIVGMVSPATPPPCAGFAALLAPAAHGRLMAALGALEAERVARQPLDIEFVAAEGDSRCCRAYLGWVRETAQATMLLDDITEQLRLERIVAQREKSALLDSLVGGVAHELNNKLTPILGFAAALEQRARRPETDRELVRGLEIVRRSASEAARIIRQLMQLSRPPTMHRAACDLAAVARDALDVLRFQLRQADCTIRLALPPAAVPVVADPTQIKQVLLNLVLNALHAVRGCQTREISVGVHCDGTVARLVVADTGCGIAPDVLPRVFDPFFTTKPPNEGTGLGLSVSDSIIRSHGGTITIESGPGAGATAYIDLPLAAGPVMAEEDDAGVPSVPPAMPGRAPSVLVIDDEEYVTNLVQEVLRTYLNCRVACTCDGLQALAILEAEPVDLVISDVRMPNLDGFDLLDRIADRWPPLARRFLFITGDPGTRTLDERLAATGVPVLFKPFPIDALVDHCRRLLGLGAGAPEHRRAAAGAGDGRDPYATVR